MRPTVSSVVLAGVLAVASFALSDAHLGAWTDGMYCPENAHVPPIKDRSGFYRTIDSLYQMERSEWWFLHARGCDVAMPRGVLKVPANGEFTANISDTKRGALTGGYAAGKQTEADLVRRADGCVSIPNMHAKNKSTATGTAFAIAYVSTIAEVTPENLVVFSVAPNTPYERLAHYKVPDLAACPEGGCICAWGWIPNTCGQVNMYMSGHKCQVTNVRPSGKRPGKAKAPGPGVKGPKQLIYAFQKSGNNYPDRMPNKQVPTYSTAMGYMNGAQTDIFSEGAIATPSTSAPVPVPASNKPSPSPSTSPPTSVKPTPKPATSPASTPVKCDVKK